MPTAVTVLTPAQLASGCFNTNNKGGEGRSSQGLFVRASKNNYIVQLLPASSVFPLISAQVLYWQVFCATTHRSEQLDLSSHRDPKTVGAGREGVGLASLLGDIFLQTGKIKISYV